MYYLEKSRNRICAEGAVSLVLVGAPDREHYSVCDARPQIGMKLFVGSLSSIGGVPRLRGRITSRVTVIVKDTPARVEFETENGSRYTWRRVTS